MTKQLETQKDGKTLPLTYITKDPSFLRIAKAINQATVYAGRVKTKEGYKDLEWSRTYGLAQRLSSQASSRDDFVSELMAFLATYEEQNLRLSEQLQKKGEVLKRVQPNKNDLDRLIELIDEFKGNTTLIANLLIAYGYASWAGTKVTSKNASEEGTDDQDSQDDENSDDTGEDEDDE